MVANLDAGSVNDLHSLMKMAEGIMEEGTDEMKGDPSVRTWHSPLRRLSSVKSNKKRRDRLRAGAKKSLVSTRDISPTARQTVVQASKEDQIESHNSYAF